MAAIGGTELNGVLAPNGNPVVLFSIAVTPGSSNNRLTFIVADTTDASYDTTVFIGALGGSLPPGLEIEKSAASTVQSGQNLTYTITYGNSGEGTASNVVIRDTLPSGTSFVSASGGGTYADGVVRWNIGTLAGNTTGRTVQFTVRVNASAGSVVNSDYTIEADGVSPIPGESVTTTITGGGTTGVENCTLVDFEGYGHGQDIGTVSGVVDVTFGESWLAIIDGDVLGDPLAGNFANEPSPDTVAVPLEAVDAIDFDPAVQFIQFYYSAAAASIPVTLTGWSGSDGTGQVVDQVLGYTVGHQYDGADCDGDPTGDFCLWDELTLTAATDNIRSITITGAVPNFFILDNMSFCIGSAVEGGEEQTVVDPEANVGKETGSATDRRGNRIIVWKQSAGVAKNLEGNIAATTQVGGIFAQVFDPDDNAVGGTINVETGFGDNVNNPTVSFDINGNFVVGFEQSGGGVFARRFNADLTGASSSFQINDVGGQMDNPEVATNNAGDFAMAWRGTSPKTMSGEAIFARAFKPDGDPKGGSVQVDVGTADEISEPAVASDAAGNFAVAWGQKLFPKSVTQDAGEGVFAVFFDPKGDPKTEPTKINNDITGDAVDPSVGADTLGNTVFAWSQDSVEGSGFDIYARRFDGDGEPLNDQVRVNAVTAGEQGRPSVAVNPAGDFAVAWESTFMPKTTQGSGEGVFARFFDSSGEPIGPDFEVAPIEDDLEPGRPEVEVGNDDTVTVAYTKSDEVGNGEGVFYRTFSVEAAPGQCVEDNTTLCLNGARFQVRVSWKDFVSETGTGRAEALTDDTGYFWFFNPDNVELVIKVLDGTGINGHYWVFFGSLSNVEYNIAVTDTHTGNTVTYFNQVGNFASLGDDHALPGTDKGLGPVNRTVEIPPTNFSPQDAYLYTQLMLLQAGGEEATKILADCTPSWRDLCLTDNRFNVRVQWRDFGGDTGAAHAVPLTSDTGYFWFFNEANVEVVVKILDGRALNDHFWVFYGALSNVAYTITITDTVTNEVKQYANELGAFASEGDNTAFYAP
jgi:uncharacterized repeat protein (TIGR01451 family)